MEYLRAGGALFNAGQYLAAHEPWEERWLRDSRGERDDCIQGLVQATAATYKARTGNWSGAVGLAESSTAYLAGCGYDDLRSWIDRLADDPALAERERPPLLHIDGDAVTVDSLEFPAAAYAAEALAETRGDEPVEQACEYALADLEAGNEASPFFPLILAYLTDESPAVRQRIADYVDRRQTRETDVNDLFE